MDYSQALAFLDEHTNLEGNRGDRFSPAMPTAGQTSGLSLEPMRQLMAALGDPQTAYRTLHITGTNGKGSTARFINSIIATMDLSCGLYISPNLAKVNERISWDGNDISDEEFAEVMTLIASVLPLIDATPSRFEILTAAALVWFAQIGVEIAVIEVGLLGRFDATNVIEGDVTVVTNVGKDHTDGADGWREAIAAEKAGIIKPKSHVVLGADLGPLRRFFEAEQPASLVAYGADYSITESRLAVGGRVVDLTTPGESYEELFLPFHGEHQGLNLATAMTAVERFFDRPTPKELIEEAIARTTLPARFEVIAHDPIIILDGAHNPHGAVAVTETLNVEFARLGSRVLVMGMLSGRDPLEMLVALNAEDFDALICTQPTWSRAIPADEIAAAATTLGIEAEVVADPVDALIRARAVTAEEDLILVSGSLYVVGEIRAALVDEN